VPGIQQLGVWRDVVRAVVFALAVLGLFVYSSNQRDIRAARALVQNGFRVLAMSKFGYLRTPLLRTHRPLPRPTHTHACSMRYTSRVQSSSVLPPARPRPCNSR
jgi:hypothetical protein